MSIKYAGAAASVVALAALTAGCSAKTATTTASSASPAASSAVSSVAPSASSSASSVPTPVGLTIPVTIVKGVVTPANGEYEATVGERIEFDVDSDAADELHVHAVPEHEFAVKPGSQSFSFVVKVPGQVVVELHSTDKTVATLTVR